MRERAIALGAVEERIVMGHEAAASTYDEAEGLRRLSIGRGWHSLLAVTSPYHTRRAQLILRDVFRDSGIAVAVQPTAGHYYSNGACWWTTVPSQRDTLNEYLKLGFYIAGYHSDFNR
jgi:uncharacterized SAM-binding protein YcdF (DUF218 family)